MDDRSNLRFYYIFGIVFQPLKKEKEEQFEPKINEQIIAPFVRLIIFGIVFQPLKKEKEEQFEPKINEQITAPFVRLVTEEGHDVVPLERAMAQAESLRMDLVEERSNQTLMKKKEECRSGMEIMKFLQRGTWNGKKAYTDFYKNIVDMREFLNAPNGKQSPPVNNRSVADQYQSPLGGRTVFDMLETDAGFLTHNAVVFVCEILDCCPCFDFLDLEDEVAENHCKGID
ncbi:hypothetical protein ACS0TY_016193 [Phlomoides rotata]